MGHVAYLAGQIRDGDRIRHSRLAISGEVMHAYPYGFAIVDRGREVVISADYAELSGRDRKGAR